MDPRQDGWETEVFAEQAEKQLKVLGDLLARAQVLHDHDVEPLLTKGFDTGTLRPEPLEEIYQASGMVVRRAILPELSQQKKANGGASGFVEELRALAQPLEGASKSASRRMR